MANTRNNVVVALTVLIALAALAWMIVRFGGTLGGLAAGVGYPVGMTVPRVDGLSEGARVTYRGRSVGRVTSIGLDASRIAFDVRLLILDGSLPANVRGVIRSTNPISGGAAVELEVQGDAAQGLLTEGPDRIAGVSASGSLIPAEVPLLAEELRGLVAEMRAQRLPETIRFQAERVGDLVASLNVVAGDGQLREDLQATVANTRRATEEAALAAEEYRRLGQRAASLGDQAEVVLADAATATRNVRDATDAANALVADARGRFDEVSDQTLGRLRQADTLLATFNDIARKADTGDGTLALLLNDPEVYRALRDDLLILGRVLQAAERVIEQVEAEGVKISIF